MNFASASPSPSPASVLAALDLGTNNCRMLVARPLGPGRGFRVIDAFSRITRLGEGLAATGILSEAAMARTIDALSFCADKMERNRVTRYRLVATEACRRAANCAEFTARVTERTGLVLDIVTADEEARLALDGCASLLDPAIPRALVFDIGGGSTELVWVAGHGERRRIDGMDSLPLGVVTLAEEHGAGLHDPARYPAIVAGIVARLERFEARHGIAAHLAERAMQMVGTSGTVTTLGALHLDLCRYDRSRVDGLRLGFDDIHAITRRLTAMNGAERADHPCIGPERADLVIAGCAILEALCMTWPLGRLTVADRGVREGILHGMMAASSVDREMVP